MESVTFERGVIVVTLEPNCDWFDDVVTQGLEVTLREHGQSAERPLIVIDMTWVDSIGSKFLAVLFATEQWLRRRQGHLAVCYAAPFCAEVLEIVKAKRVFKVFNSRHEAIDALLAGLPASLT